MTITQMECFVEAAKCGSFTNAGKVLYISQQTASRHIKALEEELGFPLFERKNKGSVLTEAGKCLYEEWNGLLQQYRTSLDRARDIYYGEQNKLKVGILDNFGMYIDEIMERLMRFEKLYPDLEMEYEILSVKHMIQYLDIGKLQIIILYSSELEKIPGIKSRCLLTLPAGTGIFCSRRHPLAQQDSLEIKDIRGQVIGILSDEASLDNKYHVLEFLEKNQIRDKVRIQEYSSRQNLGIALLAGKCVTVSYSSMFDNMNDRLAFYPIKPEVGTPEIAIAWKDDKYVVKVRNIEKVFETDKKKNGRRKT